MSEGTNNNNIGRLRPLSPHLQVYKLQFTSMLSIMHRASIVVLYIAIFDFVGYLSFVAFFPDCKFVNWFMVDPAGLIILKCGLGVYALAASYWVCATIRHLCWDMGWGFEIHTAYRTALLVLASTLVLFSAIIYFGIL